MKLIFLKIHKIISLFLINTCDKSDIFIAGHFHASENPKLITRDDLAKNHKTKVIGDISCDINGPIASTLRASTIDNPVYGYHKFDTQRS